MGVDNLMAWLANGRIIFLYTPMRKIPNFFHNACLNSEPLYLQQADEANSVKF